MLEKYRVESVLGRGGMGVVLRVTHLHLGEELALKILSPDAGGGPDVHARFLREAQSAARLRGEHVTRVGDVGVLPGGAPYIAMEYLRGADLSGELERRGVLPPGELVDYLLQACEALAEAHTLGIVHRDIKPSNLFLTYRPDGSPLVKVLDFGISKAPVAGLGALTRTDTVMGTPGYMSPEQMKASKDVDARADIWALGIVLYEGLNGRRPFDAETFSATVLRAATEPPPPMDPRIPRGLQAVVLHCLEKDRAARFPSIAQLAAALAPFARDGRAAGITVERTTVMLQGQGAMAPQAARFGQGPTATTLSGSAGMMRARSTRRYAVGGAALGVLAIVVLSIATLKGAHGTRDGGGSAGSTSGATVPDGPATSAQTDVLPGASTAPDASEVAVIVDAAVPPTSPDPAVVPAEPEQAGVNPKAKVQVCAELEVNQKWQDLRDCGGELAALGGRDKIIREKAEEFRVKAVKEMASFLAAGKLKDALAEGNLREAQKQLKGIGQDSVYFPTANDAFRTAEAKAIDDNRRKAQALATKNDCAGVKRLQVQVNTSSTIAVSAVVAQVAVKCVDRISAQPTDRPAAVAAGDPEATASKEFCDKMNVDDVMSQAQNQYQAGYPSVALALLSMALSCKHDVRMYRMAGFYACAAHDRKAAMLYYAKVPSQYQGGMAQRCQQENITIP